jgi:hypothetical protein
MFLCPHQYMVVVNVLLLVLFSFFWRNSPPPQWARVSSFTRSLDHTQRRATVGRTPLDDNTKHSQQTNIHATGWIRTYNLSRRAAADLRLRPRGHWDRLLVQLKY